MENKLLNYGKKLLFLFLSVFIIKKKEVLMKNSVLLFFAMLLLYSCSPFVSIVEVKKEMPELDSDELVYVFFEDRNDVPDSAVYIGDISTLTNINGVNKLNTSNGLVSSSKDPLIEYVWNSLVKAAKRDGGNLVIIDKTTKSTKWAILTGKLYLIPKYEKTEYSETSLISRWSGKKPDVVEGLYVQEITGIDNKDDIYTLKYGVVKTDSNHYSLVYLEGYENFPTICYLNWVNGIWNSGDIVGKFQKTNKNLLFKGFLYEYNKYLIENTMYKYDNGNLRLTKNNGTEAFRKVYPDSAVNEEIESMMTGFAIDKNKILTCNHGFPKEKCKIYIKGINGDYDKKYLAVIDKKDKGNDIAILKLQDSNAIKDYIPLPLTETNKSTAEEVFVLGYPLTSLMGDEIKLTNGIISSTSGFGGDQNAYQISAPIQPGNSGSPLFDKNGNFFGMVNSGIRPAENVGYALKLGEIKNFMTNNGYKIPSINENIYKDLSLADKVKKLQSYIYIIEIVKEKTDSDE